MKRNRIIAVMAAVLLLAVGCDNGKAVTSVSETTVAESGVTGTAVHIGDAAAKEAALAHAGLKESAVTYLTVEKDIENGVTVYEVEFHSGGYEYDYEIDAVTGKILKSDKEIDD